MIEQDLERARLAKALLDNPLLNEVLEDMKRVYINQWLASDPKEVETRERLYLSSRIVDDIAREIRIHFENGEVTKAILKKKQDRDKTENAT